MSKLWILVADSSRAHLYDGEFKGTVDRTQGT